MITKAKSKRTNGKTTSQKSDKSKLKLMPKGSRPLDSSDVGVYQPDDASIHQISQTAVSKYCDRVIDRAVVEIIKAGTDVSMYLTDDFVSEIENWISRHVTEEAGRLIEFEFQKALLIDPTIEEHARFPAAFYIWWPIVRNLRAEIWERAFNGDPLKDQLNFALAVETQARNADPVAVA